MAEWRDGYWEAADGLKLHYRDYAGGADGRPPILCLPGLTRNARDFSMVADRLAGPWRLICVDLRGRGESAHARDPMSYTPVTYVSDIEALLADLDIARFVAFGTSLGGLLTMLLSAIGPERIAGALLNDIGPRLESGGLARIRTYVGKAQTWPTWLHAARALAEGHGQTYPDFALEDWIAMAKRLCRLTPAGRIVYDYDMRIAEPLRLPNEEPFDLWPAFESLADKPVALLHGALSDLLGSEGVAEMKAHMPSLAVTEVPRVGHAPVLDEPESVVAIDTLLARIVG